MLLSMSEPAPSTADLPLLAAIQLNSSDSLADNLKFSLRQLEKAKKAGAVCAILPENFAWMGSEQDPNSVAEEDGQGPVQQFLSDTARQLALWIFGGSHKLIVPGDKANRVSNTTLVYNPQGERTNRYDKIHLFDADIGEDEAYIESEKFKAGNELSIVDLEFARVGLSICYDLRFPAMYQALRQLGADIITVPAAFTVPTGKAHWRTLLSARAIENQVYIIAPAQGGTHSNGRITWGHSLCINPWGEVVSELSDEPGIIYCPFDRQKLTELRSNMPVLRHRRSDSYSNP